MDRKLIFLDIDGVLHPGLAGTFTRLSQFELFLRQQPDIDIVISSTWRLVYSLNELRNYFSADIRHRILDVTPVLPDKTLSQRYQEIILWRKINASTGMWVALDDSADLFPEYCAELVLCETIKGIRPVQLAEILKKMSI